MYLLGFSMDNLSLMALTIGTGFVVDDAVVVLENIARHLEEGIESERSRAERQRRSWLYGDLDQPLAHRRVSADPADAGHRRTLFHEFAVTLSIAILISLVISLTVTPAMCASC